jgi:hypothetical protein
MPTRSVRNSFRTTVGHRQALYCTTPVLGLLSLAEHAASVLQLGVAENDIWTLQISFHNSRSAEAMQPEVSLSLSKVFIMMDDIQGSENGEISRSDHA